MAEFKIKTAAGLMFVIIACLVVAMLGGVALTEGLSSARQNRIKNAMAPAPSSRVARRRNIKTKLGGEYGVDSRFFSPGVNKESSEIEYALSTKKNIGIE